MLYGLVWTVIGAVILSVLSEIFLADGETKKYIKGIIAVISVAVVFSGIIGLVKQDFSVFTFTNGDETNVSIDGNYINQLKISRAEVKKEQFSKTLEDEGICGIGVTYSLDYAKDEFTFDTVYISTNNVVIADGAANIVVNDRITELAEVIFKPISGGLYLDGKLL